MKSRFALTGPMVAGAVLGAGLLMGGAAFAQAPAAPANGPTDVKPIGDWTVRCFPVQSSSPCDMYEELDDKNSHQRVLSVSIAYIPPSDRHAIQIAVPLGVSIPKGVVIQTDSFTSPKLDYRRCDRSGCYIEMILPNSSIDSLGHSGPNAAVKIVADSGKGFDLRFSLNGFAAAHDAMSTLARQKAKAAPAEAAPADAAPAAPPAQ